MTKQEQMHEIFTQLHALRSKKAETISDPIAYLRNVDPNNDYPPQLAEAIRGIWSGRLKDVAMISCRGGGKTKGAADLCSMAYIDESKRWDSLIFGGAKDQTLNAKKYINKFLRKEENIDVLTERVESSYGNTIQCLANSETSVRSPHIGDMDRGGLLFIDEEAAIKNEENLEAVFYCNNTAHPKITIRASTAQHCDGSFYQLITNADSMGYKLFSWDCLDIVRYQDYADGQEINWAKALREYEELKKINNARFRLMRPVEEAVRDFQKYWRLKERKKINGWMDLVPTIFDYYFGLVKKEIWTKERFEIEMMCMIASDPKSTAISRKYIDATMHDAYRNLELKRYDYFIVSIDWGFSKMCAVSLLGVVNNHIVWLEAKDFERSLMREIKAYLTLLHSKYHFLTVYADSEDPQNNAEIAERYPTVPVVFRQSKEELGRKLEWLFENGMFHTAHENQTAIDQLIYWKKKNGKYVKDKDHFPDSLICAMMYDLTITDGDIWAEEHEHVSIPHQESNYGNNEFIERPRGFEW